MNLVEFYFTIIQIKTLTNTKRQTIRIHTGETIPECTMISLQSKRNDWISKCANLPKGEVPNMTTMVKYTTANTVGLARTYMTFHLSSVDGYGPATPGNLPKPASPRRDLLVFLHAAVCRRDYRLHDSLTQCSSLPGISQRPFPTDPRLTGDRKRHPSTSCPNQSHFTLGSAVQNIPSSKWITMNYFVSLIVLDMV